MKTKLQMVLMVLVTLFTVSAKAQTDVTSTYLTNYGFDQGSYVTTNKSYTKGSFTGVDPESWTMKGDANCYLAQVKIASTNTINGVKATTKDYASSSEGGCLAISAGWGSSITCTQTAAASLPAGSYTISFPVYNGNTSATVIGTNLFGFVESGGTTHY